MVLCGALALPGRRTFFVSVALIGIWLSLSRAGLITGLAVILAASIYVRETFPTVIRALVIAAIAALLLPLLSAYITGTSAIAGMQSVTRLLPALNDSSVAEHLTNATGGGKMFIDHPFFGAGLGVFIHQWGGVKALVLHSTPLWLLAEFGLVGFLIFFAPIARIVSVELPRFRSNDMAGNFILLIIVGLGVMSLSHELLYQRTFWFLLGAALIQSHATPRCANSTSEP